MAARAQLPDCFVPKSLRHLFASIMLNAPEVAVADVSRWLGHRGVKTTYAVYGHIMPGAMHRGREASEAAWTNA